MKREELRKLDQEQLIDIIFNLLERVEKLEHKLNAYENPHTPSSKQRKKNTEHDPNKPRFPGKPPGSLGGGIEIPPADVTEKHTLSECPEGHQNLEYRGMRTQRVIDFPEKPLLVTEHQMFRYFCPCCDILIEATGPRDVYGPHLRSAVTMLKNLTLSCQKIADFFRQLGAPTLSAAEVQHIIGEFADKLEQPREAYLREALKNNYLHADETGMRRDGKNQQVWGIFTKFIAILTATAGRGRKYFKEIVGDYKGILVRDGYAAYDECVSQRCWAHLLRECRKYAEKNKEIELQYIRVKKIYEQMKAMLGKSPSEVAITKVKTEFADVITCLNAIRQGRKLAVHLKNGGKEWFTALYHLNVPLENNHAERGLRHIVLHRKMMGCYRNEKGKKFIDNVISVLQTWKLQEKNIFRELCMVAMQT